MLPPSSLTMGGNPKPAEKSKSIQEGLGEFYMKCEWEKSIPGILNDANNVFNVQILDKPQEGCNHHASQLGHRLLDQ